MPPPLDLESCISVPSLRLDWTTQKKKWMEDQELPTPHKERQREASRKCSAFTPTALHSLSP